MLVQDRSAERFVNTDRLALLHDELVEALHGDVAFVEPPSDLSLLEIALAPELRKIFKYLSSCLHRAGVVGHPAGGCEAAFAKSTAPFHHGRPEGLEEMGDSFVEVMRRRLHIRIVLSRMGCFTLRKKIKEIHRVKYTTYLEFV